MAAKKSSFVTGTLVTTAALVAIIVASSVVHGGPRSTFPSNAAPIPSVDRLGAIREGNTKGVRDSAAASSTSAGRATRLDPSDPSIADPGAEIVCPLNTLHGQEPVPPDPGWLAYTSDAGLGYKVFDNFVLPGPDTSIADVHWWGVTAHLDSGWNACQRDPNQFEITFYNDAGGVPGAVVSSYVLTPTTLNTGVDYGAPFNNMNYYSATLPETCILSNGWISIQAVNNPDCNFLWMTSPDGDDLAYMEWGGLTNLWNDLAFCLTPRVAFCAPGSAYGQSPMSPQGLWYTYYSSSGDPAAVVYDNFALSHPEMVVTDVHWWGQIPDYGVPCVPVSDHYQIKFYEDASGVPGAVQCSYVVTPRAVDTGLMYDTAYPLYYFGVHLPVPCALSSGWISIQDVTNGDCVFHWINSPDGDSVAYSNSYPLGDDVAFCLTGMCDQVLIEEDFESGALGWHYFSGSDSLWTITSDCSAVLSGHSPTSSLYYGGFASCDYDFGSTWGIVASPTVNLFGATTATLDFNYLLGSEGLAPTYDVATVLVSADGGGTWDTLAQNYAGGPGLELAESPSAWSHFSVDLSAYAGATVILGFSFNTVDGVSNGFPGFYVDDVRVLACLDCPLPAAPSNPYPANHETNVSAFQVLEWDGAVNDNGCDPRFSVYLGTDSSTQTLAGGGLSEEQLLVGPLAPDTTYYWYVESTNSLAGTVPSPLYQFTTGPVVAEEYESVDVPREIIDQTAITSTLLVEQSGAITDLNVALDITHVYDSDLDVTLTSPTGTVIELFSGVGGADDNFTNTVLDDQAATSITLGTAPFTGAFRPEGLLSSFNGENMEGTWTLTILDHFYDDLGTGGTLNNWSLQIPGHSSGDVPKAIANLSTITSTLVIPNSVDIWDLDVDIDITHTFDADLDVTLASPSGTVVELFTDVGGSQDNFTGTFLDDEAAISIVNGSAPFTGAFRPEGLLSGFDGEDAEGTWTLTITDDAGGDVGTLNSWSIHITENLKWVQFNYSGIETGSQTKPFNTFLEGAVAVYPGGIVRIKPGTSAETPRITKPMRIEAASAAARIGDLTPFP